MKNRIIYIFIVAVVLFTSCNKWLDVKPRAWVERKDMFSTEDGFKDVLTGCYLALKHKNLYGYAMTMGDVEHLGGIWDVTPGTTSAYLTARDYELVFVKNEVKKLYANLYNTIARTNDLLAYVDVNEKVFNNRRLREVIKAEALAIRAFCHLDLLRLFGPVPRDLSIQTNNKLGYVKEVTFNVLPRHSYQEYIAFLEADLLEASELLKKSDPILLSTTDAAEVVSEEQYLDFRTFRFNYYAVEALKARFYLYTQQNTKAFESAMAVIDAKDTENKIKFKLAEDQDYANLLYTLPTEHLLSLNVFDLKETTENYFKKAGSSDFLRKNRDQVLKDVYENSPTDRRFTSGWHDVNIDATTTYFTIKKYLQPEDKANETEMVFIDKQIIPLIRLSEMYLIAMETGPIADCNRLGEIYCSVRNIPLRQFPENIEQRELEILKEYRKDFYGEGQMFYTYKRLAAKLNLWNPEEVKLESYIVHQPDNEYYK